MSQLDIKLLKVMNNNTLIFKDEQEQYRRVTLHGINITDGEYDNTVRFPPITYKSAEDLLTKILLEKDNTFIQIQNIYSVNNKDIVAMLGGGTKGSSSLWWLNNTLVNYCYAIVDKNVQFMTTGALNGESYKENLMIMQENAQNLN